MLKDHGVPLQAQVGRFAGASLLVASGAVHLDLYLTSYHAVPTIGPLFVLQFAAALAIGLAVMASASPLPAIAGALFALSTLGGYILSLWVGLFGFREVRTAAGIVAGALEVAAFIALGAYAVRAAEVRVLAAAAASSGPRVPGRAPVERLAAPLTSAVARYRLGVVPVGAAALLALVLAEVPGTSPSSGEPHMARFTVMRADNRTYGKILVDADGLTLYTFTNHGHPVSCTGACASVWPLLTLEPGSIDPAPGPGVSGLGTTTINGQRQVTDHGLPLFTYAGDNAPGQATGQGIVSFGGTWRVAR